MENLSQKRRAEMLEYLNHLKEIHTDDESRIALEKIETALTEKKYGLVWEEHEEEVDKKLVHNIPVFREIEDKKIVADENKDFNFLLEGDNLHSLKLLEKTHKGKVDVIYIDPPYNTGNKDFIYDDSFVDKTDGYAHSKWLSFMSERLELAKRLLSDKGFTFISIDDNEVFQLKLLCDEIFGADNFIVSLPRQTKRSGKTTGSFSKNHDYLLVYSNGSLESFKMKSHTDSDYKYKDEFFDTRGFYKLNQTLDYDSLSYSKSLDYPLEINNETYYPGGDKGKWEQRQLGAYNRADWAWRWSKTLFDFAYKNGFVVIKKKKDGTSRIYTKTYANVKIEKENDNYVIVSENRTKATSSMEFTENIYSNDNAKKDLKKLGLEKNFDYSKPVNLIKEIINMHKANNAIILDFFAGSGTTGQAVMQLNKEDGGKRKFILCTNNENGIAENVCYKRIEKVIMGYKYTSRKKEIEVEELPSNLKYYKTEFIPKFSEDEEILSSKLLDYIKEMVELENMCEIDGNSRRIILSDEDLKLAISEMEEASVLYIPSFILLTNEIKNKIEKRKLQIVAIPDYYFEDELKEANEL